MYQRPPNIPGVSSDHLGHPQWGQMAQRSSLLAPPARETPQEPRSQAILPAHSEIPEALPAGNPPPQPLSSILCLSPSRHSCECTGGLREAPCACDDGANFWFAGMPQRRCLRPPPSRKPSPTHRQIGCIFNWNSSHLQGKALSVEIEPTASWLPPFHPPCLLKRNPPPYVNTTHGPLHIPPSMVVKEGLVGSAAPCLGCYSWAHPAETTQGLLPGKWALVTTSGSSLSKALGTSGLLRDPGQRFRLLGYKRPGGCRKKETRHDKTYTVTFEENLDPISHGAGGN